MLSKPSLLASLSSKYLGVGLIAVSSPNLTTMSRLGERVNEPRRPILDRRAHGLDLVGAADQALLLDRFREQYFLLASRQRAAEQAFVRPCRVGILQGDLARQLARLGERVGADTRGKSESD